MRAYNTLFAGLAVAFLLFTGCSKDNPETPDPNILKLEGQWKFEKLDFQDESVKWDPETDFTTAASFGYAPLMFEGMQGFDFTTQKTKDNAGNKFDFVSEGSYNQDPSKEYWYWNYTDNNKGFEIRQINPQSPPFNFSVMNITNIRISNNGQSLVFKASLNSRKPGGAMTDIIQVPVEITLSKGTPTTEVKMFIKGADFEMPKPLTNRQKLLNTHWKLAPGSEVYDPGFNDQDPEKEYLKLVAVNLAEDNKLNYRYSYPMGIVSAKSLVQDALDKDTLKVKQGGSFGAAEQIIAWKIESIDKAAKQMKLKEDKSGTVRTFVQVDDINNDVDKTEYTITGN